MNGICVDQTKEMEYRNHMKYVFRSHQIFLQSNFNSIMESKLSISYLVKAVFKNYMWQWYGFTLDLFCSQELRSAIRVVSWEQFTRWSSQNKKLVREIGK